MTMPDARQLEMPCFHRRTADTSLNGQFSGWEVWDCEGPEFRHYYDRTVTLIVQTGAANLLFADGSQADLHPGDALTILQGASAIWTITAPIQNCYAYHDLERPSAPPSLSQEG